MKLDGSVSKLAGVSLILIALFCVIMTQYGVGFQFATLGAALIGLKTAVAGSVKKSEYKVKK
jgi:hypothetical protein